MRAFDPYIPILFFSGAAYEADKRKGIAAGANGYVVKPNIFELMRSTKQLMSRDVPQSEIRPGELLPLCPARNASRFGQSRRQLSLVVCPGVPSPSGVLTQEC
jgi:DNA-binding response OmpR family regulator